MTFSKLMRDQYLGKNSFYERERYKCIDIKGQEYKIWDNNLKWEISKYLPKDRISPCSNDTYYAARYPLATLKWVAVQTAMMELKYYGNKHFKT
jgi:hypothetical protein